MVRAQKKLYNVHTFIGPRKNSIVWEFLKDISLFNAADSFFFTNKKPVQRSKEKRAPGCLLGIQGMKCYPVMCGLFQGSLLNHQHPSVPNTS